MNHPTEARIFRLDVTPPIGSYVCGGLHGRAIGVEEPLELRGVILSSDDVRCAIAVVDYCYLCGKSHRRMLQAIARGADLPPTHVSLHANHVHDAPLINEEAHATFADTVPGVHDEQYFARVLRELEQTVRSACQGDAIRTGGVSFTSSPVYRFASTRRVILPDKTCAVRWSVLRDAQNMYLKSYPEGKIDPMLDQVTLYDATLKPRVSMNFYAVHPQVSDGRLMWSADTIGVARNLFQGANPDVFTMNFNGCGGDITAGKYSTPNRHRNRLVFGLRLYDAMQAAFDHATPEPLHRLGWHHHVFDMPLRIEENDEQHHLSILRDPNSSTPAKYLAAIKYFKLHDRITSYPFELARLTLNDDDVLMMPAELCIDYQLYAKRAARSRLAAAAYADSFLNYIATNRAFEEGGYEVQPGWTEVSPGCEELIKSAIDTILSKT